MLCNLLIINKLSYLKTTFYKLKTTFYKLKTTFYKLKTTFYKFYATYLDDRRFNMSFFIYIFEPLIINHSKYGT